MTSPWPTGDLATGRIMCCLCFGTFSFEELSKNDEGYLTDVCIPCREAELAELERRRKLEGEAEPAKAPPGSQEDEARQPS